MVLGLNQLSVAILVGGLGTRLREVVSDRPKVVAEVAGTPFLNRILSRLKAEGITEVVLCTGYRSDQIEALYGEEFEGIKIEYSVEASPLGTAGALAFALTKVQHEHLLVLNGDSYVEFSLQDMLETFNRLPAAGLLLLREVPEVSRFGAVTLESSGCISGFAEKGRQGNGLINAGAYLLNKTLLEDIPDARACSLENEMFPRWVAERKLYGCLTEGFFLDIGTPDSYREANKVFGSK